MSPRSLNASRRSFSMLLTAPLVMLGLSACSSLPTSPVRATVYDFGPGALDAAALTPPVGLPQHGCPGWLTSARRRHRHSAKQGRGG